MISKVQYNIPDKLNRASAQSYHTFECKFILRQFN